MNLKGKRILVVGMAVSGVAVVRALCKHGAHVIANDIKEAIELQHVINDIPMSSNIEYVLGIEPDMLIDRCDMVVVSPGVPLDKPFVEKARRKGIEVIGEVELAYRLSKAPIIAITGTNGKTTTTALTGNIFQKSGKRTFICGNIGTPMISDIEEYGADDIVVAEISSFQLESIKCFKPVVSAILNITDDHLNRHKTFANYVAVKSRIFMNQEAENYTVLNADNPATRKLLDMPQAKVLLFSRKEILSEGAMIQNNHIVCRIGEKEDIICRPEEIKIPGAHNLENALAASIMAYAMGIKPELIAEVLRSFPGVEHRIEFVMEINGIRFVNDSKGTNPDAAIKAIEAVKGPIILIAGGMDKHADFTDFVKTFDDKVKALVLIGETADKIAATAKNLGFTNIYMATSMEDAVWCSWQLASPGDCVLLSPACASWDMFDNYEQRGRIFKDAVRRLGG